MNNYTQKRIFTNKINNSFMRGAYTPLEPSEHSQNECLKGSSNYLKHNVNKQKFIAT